MLLGTGDGDFGPPITLAERPFSVLDLDGDGRPDLIGTHFDERAWGYFLDVWLNATP